MRKNLLLNLTFILFAALLIPGCRKLNREITEETTQGILPAARIGNQCKLTFAIDLNGYSNWFQYNDKGLVNEWRIDFGDDISNIINITYNEKDQLSYAEWYSDGTLYSTIEFIWTGKYITSENWNQDGFLFEVVNTFDKKGLLIKRESSYGAKGETEYSPKGNPINYSFHFEDELMATDVYTYDQPNKNPFLAIPGLPYLFPYAGSSFGKQHETSDRFTIYQNGIPLVLLDTDPAQTIMQSGSQNYLSSVTFFDNVSESFITRNFEYQNCGSDHSNNNLKTSPLSSTVGSKINSMKILIVNPAKPIKKQIEELRKIFRK